MSLPQNLWEKRGREKIKDVRSSLGGGGGSTGEQKNYYRVAAAWKTHSKKKGEGKRIEIDAYNGSILA